MPALHRIADDLADERLGAASAASASASPLSGPDAKVVVAHREMAVNWACLATDGSSCIESIVEIGRRASSLCRATAEIILLLQSPPPTPTAALLSGHPPSRPPFNAVKILHPAPIDASERPNDLSPIIATCSPKRARRGHSMGELVQLQVGRARRRRSCRMRCHRHHFARRTAGSASRTSAAAAWWMRWR